MTENDGSSALNAWDVQSKRIYSDATGQGRSLVCVESGNTRAVVEIDKSPTLNAGHEQPIVCISDDNGKAAVDFDMAGSLKCGGAAPMCAKADENRYIVRRLLPVECERLQGFPDGWTDLAGCDVDAVVERVSATLGYEEGSKERKKLEKNVGKWSKETPDTPRYKACGNSMTTYVIELLGRRIQAFDELHYDEIGLENDGRMGE